MTLLHAIVLGIIQGLTEFIPISSTAHLRVLPALLGWEDPGAAFSAVIQLGTTAALLIYFRRDIVHLTSGFLAGLRNNNPLESLESRMAWFIGLGTIPIVVFGLLLKGVIETKFRSLWVIAASLTGLALILAFAESRAKLRKEQDSIDFFDSQVIGLAQALALIPGASRSGVTITAGLLLGLTREAAARFSFLLSIPAVTAAGLFELWEIRHQLHIEELFLLSVSTIVSGIFGYLSIALLLRYLRTHSTFVFIWYRILLGALIVGLLRAGLLHG